MTNDTREIEAGQLGVGDVVLNLGNVAGKQADAIVSVVHSRRDWESWVYLALASGVTLVRRADDKLHVFYI